MASSLNRLLAAEPRSICMIKPSALGDVIQTLPLLQVLRSRFPQASITWVIGSASENLIETHPLIDRRITFHRRGGWPGWKSLLAELNAARFDLVFDFQGLLRTGVMTLATRAHTRVGLESAREGSHLACNVVLPDTGRLVPASRRYWRLADILGQGQVPQDAGITLTADDRAFAEQHLGHISRPVVAIHAGAKWVTKRWSPTGFAAVAMRAARSHDFLPVIVGGPDEKQLAATITNTIADAFPRAAPLNLAGQTTLRQLAAILQRADVMLSNDSGPMHLAAAMGTPVCGIFLCTDSERSGPAGPQHQFATTQLECAGSYRKKCPHSGRDCMACKDELTVDRVWTTFEQTLAPTAQRDVA